MSAVKATFMCQLDWDKRCQDNWWTYFWGPLWRCFWKKLPFCSVYWRKKVHPDLHGWVLSNLLSDQNATERGRKGGVFLLFSPWSGMSIFPCPWSAELLGLWVLGLTKDPLILRPSDSDWNIQVANSLVLQLADSKQVMGLHWLHNDVNQFLW